VFPGFESRIIDIDLAGMAAEMLAPLVADDSPQPRTEIAGDIEAAEIAPGGDEGVLHKVGGGGFIS
jgi:hypothetical protein